MKMPVRSIPSSWVEVNLAALRENYQTISGKLPPAVKIMAVVKADAYGHGLVPVARELVRMGVQSLGVGSVEEGIVIREKVSATIPVVLLLGCFEEESSACLRYRLTPVLFSLEVAQKLHRAARFRKTRIPVHLKVDTGMGRLGVPWSDFEEFLQKILRLNGLKITGLTSHFGQADEKEKTYNRLQWKRFAAILGKVHQAGIKLTENHMANSAALINYKQSHLHYTRPGILLYGHNPSDARSIKVKQVMSLKSRILQVKQIPAGVEVSYGGTYITSSTETIAVIPVGYANGYPRILSNRGVVLIRGRRFPIIGRICMNLIIVRLDPAIHWKENEEVVLLGGQEREFVTADELALKADTIPYELFCLLGRLSPRKYLGLSPVSLEPAE